MEKRRKLLAIVDIDRKTINFRTEERDLGTYRVDYLFLQSVRNNFFKEVGDEDKPQEYK